MANKRIKVRDLILCDICANTICDVTPNACECEALGKTEKIKISKDYLGLANDICPFFKDRRVALYDD